MHAGGHATATLACIRPSQPTALFLSVSAHRRLRSSDLARRIPAVPSPTDDGTHRAALVRRLRRRVDYMHVVLPGTATARILVCARRRNAVRRAQAAMDTSCVAGRQWLRAAARCGYVLETCRCRRPDAANSAVARLLSGFAVFCSRSDQSAATVLVRNRAQRTAALSAVRFVELRLHGSIAQLSRVGGTLTHATAASTGLVGGLRGVRGGVGGRG